MKNDNNIIIEKFHKPLLKRWSPNDLKRAIQNTIIPRFLKKDLRRHFDGFFVPADWFSFKEILRNIDKDSFEIVNIGKPGTCECEISCSLDISPEDATKLIYGDPKEKKYGGIIYNEAFAEKLEIIGITRQDESPDADAEEPDEYDDSEEESEEEPAESSEEEPDEVEESISIKKFIDVYHKIILEADIPEEETEEPEDIPEEESDGEEDDEESENANVEKLKLTIEFKFDNVEFKPGENAKLKPRDYFNPNYLTQLSGNVYFLFNDNEETLIKVGTVSYSPKRTEDMDPPPKVSLKENLKNLWNDTTNRERPADFGVAGVLAKNAFKKMAGGIFNAVVGNEVQPETVEINFDKRLAYKNNLKRERDKQSKARHDQALSNTEDESIVDRIKNELVSINEEKFTLAITPPDKARKIKIAVKARGIGTTFLSMTIQMEV